MTTSRSSWRRSAAQFCSLREHRSDDQ
jgi:hypothetical protein